MLHGVVSDVEVMADAQVQVEMRAFGSGTLKIENTPDEGNAYVFLGLKPTLG